jgi:hypothetical protein
MMFHIKLFFFTQMIVYASLTKYRINSIMLTEENISKLFLSFKLFELLCENFIAKLVDETVEKTIKILFENVEDFWRCSKKS